MTTKLKNISIIMLALAALSCSDLGTEPGSPIRTPHPMPPLDLAQQSVVHSSNWFGMNLFKQLNAGSTGRNLMISPLSVSMALGMTLNGARGATKDAMAQTLGVVSRSSDQINTTYSEVIQGLTNLDPTVQMDIGNSIWYSPILQVEQAFKDVNTTCFYAQIRSLDFAAPGASGVINGWVGDATHGKIPTIVPDPIPDSIVMYLINAIYFKGSWTHQFDPSSTRAEVFHESDGSTAPCQMMNIQDTIPCFIDSALECVDLPYGLVGFSMTIVLPPEGVNIDQFIATEISSERIAAWSTRLRKSEVRLSMPKFKLEYKETLTEVLKQLGMGIAFSNAADFTGIDKRGSLAISEVLHKTFIQVDEVGTEAAAVTSVAVGATAIGGGIPSIVLDRPFVYVIREHASGTILFIGKLARPEW